MIRRKILSAQRMHKK